MRESTRRIGQRAHLAFSRGLVGSINDSSLMQQSDGGHMAGESSKKVERVQHYGFTAVPMGPNKGGEGTDSSNPMEGGGWGAESHTMYNGGNRGHPVIMGIDDRRHRWRDLQPGESAQHDHQGQGTYIANHGSYMIAGGHGENKDKARASIRWVEKQQQPYPDGMGKGSSTQGAKDHQHQGDDPSAEFFAEKDRTFAKAAKSLLHEHTDGLYTLVDDKHVAMFASSGTVAWMDKSSGKPKVTKPWEVEKYPYSKPSPTSTGKGQQSGGGGG